MELDDLMDSGEDKKSKVVVEGIHELAQSLSKELNGGAIMKPENFTVPDVIPTGIDEIDWHVLGHGGLYVGRVTEIAGETSAGKTTLALNFCKEAIEQGKKVVICENEGTFTVEYANKIGLDPESYYLFKSSDPGNPNAKELNGRQFLDRVLALIEAGFDIIVLDSIQGLVDEKYQIAGMENVNMNTKQSTASMTADWFKLLKGGWEAKLKKNKGKIVKYVDGDASIVVINHLKKVYKDKYDYGKPDKDSTGGEDLKFLYTVRLQMEHLGFSKERDDNGDPLYTKSRVSCVKHKLGVPARSAIIYISSATGRITGDNRVVLHIAEKRGFVYRPNDKGAWYYLNVEKIREYDAELLKDGLTIDGILQPVPEGDEVKFQGGDATVKFLRENKPLLNSLLNFKKVL